MTTEVKREHDKSCFVQIFLVYFNNVRGKNDGVIDFFITLIIIIIFFVKVRNFFVILTCHNRINTSRSNLYECNLKSFKRMFLLEFTRELGSEEYVLSNERCNSRRKAKTLY